jgi:iron complex outermembrane receptor protein
MTLISNLLIKARLQMERLQENSYSEHATTPSLMLQYFKDENSMFYASYSDGFKSGGYEALGTALANNGAYNSEGVDAYEFGYKTSSDKMKVKCELLSF